MPYKISWVFNVLFRSEPPQVPPGQGAGVAGMTTPGATVPSRTVTGGGPEIAGAGGDSSVLMHGTPLQLPLGEIMAVTVQEDPRGRTLLSLTL